MTETKLDIILDRVNEISSSNASFRNDILIRLNRIEKDVNDLTEFKGKVAGACAVASLVFSTIFGWLFKHINV